MGEPRRGRLAVYLGAAAGVGNTTAMLAEGTRLANASSVTSLAVHRKEVSTRSDGSVVGAREGSTGSHPIAGLVWFAVKAS